MKFLYCYIILIFLILNSCSDYKGNAGKSGRVPVIEPDYTGVTIPPNIAPINFIIRENGDKFVVRVEGEKTQDGFEIRSGNGKIRFPEIPWKKLVEGNSGGRIRLEIISSEGGRLNVFEPFFFEIAPEKVDPYLAYRLIPPGYYSWSHIRIMQRCLENFNEKTVLDNNILEKNCINCHSFAGNDPDRFMVHIRGSNGGTYFLDNGRIIRTDPKTEGMPGSATYPSWHPSGRYIAYSSNQVRQSFYAGSEKSIEVFDLTCSMILFDTKDNEIIAVNEEDTSRYLRTFPGWSPDGKYLYYCRALNTIPADQPAMEHITAVHHNIVRKKFDEASETFGPTEVIFDAASIDRSVSFPRISPDGKFLVFTLHDFGTFPIWHAEADLYSLDMQTGNTSRLDLNSSFSESYHSWSSNSRWLVFSSKRSDGRSTRPYIAYIAPDGKSSKPFMIPQNDPDYYNTLIESFNIPEFIKGEIKTGPRDFAAATRQKAIKAKQSFGSEVVLQNNKSNLTGTSSRALHE